MSVSIRQGQMERDGAPLVELALKRLRGALGGRPRLKRSPLDMASVRLCKRDGASELAKTASRHTKSPKAQSTWSRQGMAE